MKSAFSQKERRWNVLRTKGESEAVFLEIKNWNNTVFVNLDAGAQFHRGEGVPQALDLSITF